MLSASDRIWTESQSTHFILIPAGSFSDGIDIEKSEFNYIFPLPRRSELLQI